MDNIPLLLQGYLQGFGDFLVSGVTGFFDHWIIYTFVLSLAYYFWKYYTPFGTFGVDIITGAMGAGKTYFTFLNAYKATKKKNRPFIISNIPYPFVDLYFNSLEDYLKIIDYFVRYSEMTNKIPILKRYFEMQKILLIGDEFHLYFSALEFEKIFKDKKVFAFFTQCRKRRIKNEMITQDYGQLPARLRQLAPYMIRYDNFVGFLKKKVWYYFHGEGTNHKDETVADVMKKRVYLAPGFMLWASPIRKEYLQWEYLSYWLVGGTSALGFYSYEQFLKDLTKYGKNDFINDFIKSPGQ